MVSLVSIESLIEDADLSTKVGVEQVCARIANLNVITKLFRHTGKF